MLESEQNPSVHFLPTIAMMYTILRFVSHGSSLSNIVLTSLNLQNHAGHICVRSTKLQTYQQCKCFKTSCKAYNENNWSNMEYVMFSFLITERPLNNTTWTIFVCHEDYFCLSFVCHEDYFCLSWGLFLFVMEMF